jgi:hypothetical protein
MKSREAYEGKAISYNKFRWIVFPKMLTAIIGCRAGAQKNKPAE